MAYYLYRPFIESFIPDDLVYDATLHRWESYNESLNKVVIGANVKAQIARLERPVHLLYGTKDGYTPPSALEQLGVPLLSITGGHNFLQENPSEAFNAIDQVLKD